MLPKQDPKNTHTQDTAGLQEEGQLRTERRVGVHCMLSTTATSLTSKYLGPSMSRCHTQMREVAQQDTPVAGFIAQVRGTEE